MATHMGKPSLSLQHGFRYVTEATVTEEDLGFENVAYASRIKKAVVFFLKQEHPVDRMVEQLEVTCGCVSRPNLKLSAS
jgi:hypothetical protein